MEWKTCENRKKNQEHFPYTAKRISIVITTKIHQRMRRKRPSNTFSIGRKIEYQYSFLYNIDKNIEAEICEILRIFL